MSLYLTPDVHMLKTLVTKLEKNIRGIVEQARHELSGIRTGRASAILVENIMVESYGSKMPLKQLASIGVMPPKEINIQVWDISMVNTAAKAIETAGLGVTPQIDGNVIRVSLPPLTIERRQELVKYVGKLVEEKKIKIRASRDEANKEVKELKDEDERFRAKDKVQETVDRANKEIESMLEAKVREIHE